MYTHTTFGDLSCVSLQWGITLHSTHYMYTYLYYHLHSTHYMYTYLYYHLHFTHYVYIYVCTYKHTRTYRLGKLGFCCDCDQVPTPLNHFERREVEVCVICQPLTLTNGAKKASIQNLLRNARMCALVRVCKISASWCIHAVFGVKT
jgi:hypothetical protein